MAKLTSNSCSDDELPTLDQLLAGVRLGLHQQTTEETNTLSPRRRGHPGRLEGLVSKQTTLSNARPKHTVTSPVKNKAARSQLAGGRAQRTADADPVNSFLVTRFEESCNVTSPTQHEGLRLSVAEKKGRATPKRRAKQTVDYKRTLVEDVVDDGDDDSEFPTLESSFGSESEGDSDASFQMGGGRARHVLQPSKSLLNRSAPKKRLDVVDLTTSPVKRPATASSKPVGHGPTARGEPHEWSSSSSEKDDTPAFVIL